MRIAFLVASLLLALPGTPACAQMVVEDNTNVASDSPEGWAMRYFAGTTLMTSFGETAKLAPWKWNVALEAGSIPRLGDAQQQVGFGGSKQEDLNKSPVFGRLRLALGLPEGWVAELGYTPPLEIDGSRARNIFAVAIGKRLFDADGLSFSMRALAQAGKVEGDITCPAKLAGVTDPAQNPFGCKSPSNDTFTTNYYGLDATLGYDAGGWKWYAGAGIVRADLEVQVDAQLFSHDDRSRVNSSSNLPWLTLGVRHDFTREWSLGAEVLYVPLEVRRPPGYGNERDSLASVRVQLRYAID
jgi:hypothetical protein